MPSCNDLSSTASIEFDTSTIVIMRRSTRAVRVGVATGWWVGAFARVEYSRLDWRGHRAVVDQHHADDG